MSGSEGGSLLELFREEVRTNVQLLNEGLIALEQNPAELRQIEPLMRAAHSIKGAARVVNIDSAAGLAHAAEDCLVAAQERRITLGPGDIDVLLQAADILAGIAESAGPHLEPWLAQSRGEIESLLTTLQQRASGTTSGADETAQVAESPAKVIPTAPESDRSAALVDAIAGDRAETYDASPIIELFQSETMSNVAALRTGLADLEQADANEETRADLVKRVQAIRSAARLVNVGAAVEVARALASTLERWHQRTAREPTAQLTELARAVDYLEAIAGVVGPDYSAWLDENEEALLQMVERLRPAGDSANRSPETQEVANEESAIDSPATPTPATNGDAPESRDEKAIDSAEQVVRVTAESLSRLMGLAGESLVEARWLQPFSKSLLELKRRQTLLADHLEQLQQRLPGDLLGDEAGAVLSDAGDQLESCRDMLALQMQEFENRARNVDDLNNRLYHEVIASRMRPFGDGVQGFPRMVRDLSRQLGKQVEFKIHGKTTAVDRDILEKLEAPLNHVLRNALDHGLETPEERSSAGKPETCRLEVDATHSAGMLVITVRDDGRGVDIEKIRAKVVERKLADERIARDLSEAELLEFLFLPAFSTAKQVTEVSGRGVGLDVVHSMVQAAGGSVRVQSSWGAGTTFRLKLPITLSVIRAVLVKIAGEPYAFPHNRIDRLIRVPKSDFNSLEGGQYFEVGGSNVGVVVASQILELESAPSDKDDVVAVLFSSHTDEYGLVVDELCGESDLVVRPIDARLGKIPNLSAAAILDDGSPVLIVDVDDMRRSIERKLNDDATRHSIVNLESATETTVKRVLVVDDSITVREVQRQLLSNHGYAVAVAVDGMEGWNTLSREQFDLVITDVDMPRMNGIELVRRIKGDSQLRATPVVIVSYKDREEDRLRGLDAGADYYLTKSSFHDDSLLDAVQDLIGEAYG